jgi:hypothetical protein
MDFGNPEIMSVVMVIWLTSAHPQMALLPNFCVRLRF